ncbi:MAG: class I SAM-dependent methyltransferase [Candidatus Saccharibacteria bacterium]|nr:class I SAM-dependent methyltransferase [Candidatus Saccharibacteria bacterium]
MPKKSDVRSKTAKGRKADQYNDPSHNYLHYWNGRDYEHMSEVVAIRRLLKGRRFKHAVDIGGGYGRLSITLGEFADKVTLAEPSQQQLDIAKGFLKDHPHIEQKLVQAGDMPFKDGSVDLFAMIRVMHHLPDPTAEFKELSRALSDDGWLILEVANYAHGRNRVKHLLKGKKLPVDPVDIRSAANKRDDEIPFVNHNPKTVIKQLAHAGLKVEKVLSVSNLRSPGLKKMVPRGLMLSVERVMQPTLAKTYFGPSVFLLVRKVKPSA